MRIANCLGCGSEGPVNETCPCGYTYVWPVRDDSVNIFRISKRGADGYYGALILDGPEDGPSYFFKAEAAVEAAIALAGKKTGPSKEEAISKLQAGQPASWGLSPSGTYTEGDVIVTVEAVTVT